MDHRATIQAGHTVFVGRDAEINKLVIERGANGQQPGTLDIQGPATLVIHDGLKMGRRPKDATSARIVFSGLSTRPGSIFSARPLDVYGDVEVTGRGGGVLRTEPPWQLISVGRHARLISSGGPLTVVAAVEMDGTLLAEGDLSERIQRSHEFPQPALSGVRKTFERRSNANGVGFASLHERYRGLYETEDQGKATRFIIIRDVHGRLSACGVRPRHDGCFE